MGQKANPLIGLRFHGPGPHANCCRDGDVDAQALIYAPRPPRNRTPRIADDVRSTVTIADSAGALTSSR